MIHKKHLHVPAKDAAIIRNYLETEPASEDECLGEDRIITYTVNFGGGYEMDVKLCGVRYNEEEESNKPWTEAVLFKNGSEICCTEPGDEFFGEWQCEVGEDVYIAFVTAEQPAPADTPPLDLSSIDWKRDRITKEYVEENRNMLMYPSKMDARKLGEAVTYCQSAWNPFSYELMRRSGHLSAFRKARGGKEKSAILDKSCRYHGFMLY